MLDFHACRYAKALAHLASMLPILSLDMHLDSHLQALHLQVREGAGGEGRRWGRGRRG